LVIKRGHIAHGPTAKILYFAYGSNMLTRRLRAPDRCPSAVAVGSGFLNGRRLTFDKVGSDGSGKCDIEATSNSSDRACGVLFEIDCSEKPALDRAEGLGKGYCERSMGGIYGPNGYLREFRTHFCSLFFYGFIRYGKV